MARYQEIKELGADYKFLWLNNVVDQFMNSVEQQNVFRAERKILKRCGNYLNKIYLEAIVYMIIFIYGVRSHK